MAEIIFNTESDNEQQNNSTISDGGTAGGVYDPIDDGDNSVETDDTDNSENTIYSSEELSDPNKIVVEIADKETPLVILFGPQSCGKTMTMIRLTRYLHEKGFSVEPIKSFRPEYDQNYKKLCEGFNELVNSEDAAHATNIINFMLIRVSHRGKAICQILEAPGEHYFSPNEGPDKVFVKYINTILDSKNRKLFCIMLEPEGTNGVMTTEVRKLYSKKVHKLKRRMKAGRDRVIFILNKIDKTDFVISRGNVNRKYAKKAASDLYSGIFAPFTNENPITKLWKPYNFDFEVFQTGNFSDGVFTEGPEDYPRNLWKLISKRVKGL